MKKKAVKEKIFLCERDEAFMREALRQAKIAFLQEEVPIGAVLVQGDEVVARAHNEVEKRGDATAHAELLVIQRASQKKGDWRLTDMVLYTTLEPCSMCAGALFSSRIRRVVWGAADVRQGADGSWVSILRKPHPIHSLEVKGGILREEAGELMKAFFRKKRKEAKLDFHEEKNSKRTPR